MALFGKKKTAPETKEVAVVEKKKAPSTGGLSRYDANSGIIKPHITEKAAVLTDQNVFTFLIRKGTTKFEVRDAVQKLYNVTPVKVHIVNKAPRHYMSRSRGRKMMEEGMRKAYVYLKKGDRIELI